MEIKLLFFFGQTEDAGKQYFCMTKTLQGPEDQQNCHISFVINFFSVYCVLWNVFEFEVNALIQSKRTITICCTQQNVQPLSSVFTHNTSIESFHVPYMKLSQNPDEAPALLMQLVSQKALENISHLHYNISYCIFDSTPEQRAVTWFGGSCSIMHGCL